MTAARAVLGALGAAATAYGLWRLLGLGTDQVVPVLAWAVGGVVLHDAVIAPLVVLLGVAAVAWAPTRLRPALVWALVVLGPLTLVAVPVLGRFGAKADNPSLLDRPYWLGYALLVVVVLVLSALAALREGGPGRPWPSRSARSRRSSPAGPPRR